MSEFSGLSSHVKIKVRRENSYQLVRTMNIVFLCKSLLYQLSDTSLRDYFLFLFFNLSFKPTSCFFKGRAAQLACWSFQTLLNFLIAHSVLHSAEPPSPPSPLWLHQMDLSSTLSSSPVIMSFGKQKLRSLLCTERSQCFLPLPSLEPAQIWAFRTEVK